MTEWKRIEGFDSYQISTEGEIKNKNGELLKPFIVGKGYLQVHLFQSGVRTKLYIHRLVAEAFVENAFGCKEVNHKDGNKKNNSASNLEWVTRAKNLQHSCYALGNHVKAVKCIETGVVYPSIHEAARQTGASRNGISMCCTGKQQKAQKLHWRYAT